MVGERPIDVAEVPSPVSIHLDSGICACTHMYHEYVKKADPLKALHEALLQSSACSTGHRATT